MTQILNKAFIDAGYLPLLEITEPFHLFRRQQNVSLQGSIDENLANASRELIQRLEHNVAWVQFRPPTEDEIVALHNQSVAQRNEWLNERRDLIDYSQVSAGVSSVRINFVHGEIILICDLRVKVNSDNSTFLDTN